MAVKILLFLPRAGWRPLMKNAVPGYGSYLGVGGLDGAFAGAEETFSLSPGWIRSDLRLLSRLISATLRSTSWLMLQRVSPSLTVYVPPEGFVGVGRGVGFLPASRSSMRSRIVSISNPRGS